MTEFNQQETLTQLHKLLASKSMHEIPDLLFTMHPAEIADFLENLPSKSRDLVWEGINAEHRSSILTHLHGAVRSEFLGQMGPQEVSAATEEMEADDAADIIQELPDAVQDTVLRSMDAQNRLRLTSVLSYSEHTAGGLMNIDIIPIRADASLDVVIRYLKQLDNIPQKTDHLIVVDRANHYLGDLSIFDILLADPKQKVAELITEAVAIPCDLSDTEVAKLFEQQDLVSVAVVNSDNLLLGRITIDDVVDVIQEEAEHTVRSLVGLGEDDMFGPTINSAKRRAIWLGINLATAFLAAWVIGVFAETIEQMVALAVLLPVVASMGGISGTQTLTITIRGIALSQLDKNNFISLIFKEVSVAFLNGLVWAVLIAIVTILWFKNIVLGGIIGLAIMINFLVAAFFGVVIPFTLKRYNIDPAIAGGVLLTTVTDVVGFLLFLGLAAWLLVVS
ncbi:Mg/Co/Ni transporter MgtE / CBS domain [uncultured Candidatus Thioglobus sp.]|nr:Mg/Co/Ni transporter MgtE / CBS domain [uncultured Candidatus Thioglobus sp.]